MLDATGGRACQRFLSIRSCPEYLLNEHRLSILNEQSIRHNAGRSYAQTMSKEESFSSRLRARVEELGFVQAKLGIGLKPNGGDLGRAAVNGWLSGLTQPSASQLAVICKRLDISADYLLFGNIEMASPRVDWAKSAIDQLSPQERAALLRAITPTDSPSPELGTGKTPVSNTSFRSDTVLYRDGLKDIDGHTSLPIPEPERDTRERHHPNAEPRPSRGGKRP